MTPAEEALIELVAAIAEGDPSRAYDAVDVLMSLGVDDVEVALRHY